MRNRILTVAGCCIAALSACNTADEPVSDAEAIRALFERYQQVVADEDAAVFCNDLLAPSELAGTSVSRCTEVIGKRIGSEGFQQLGNMELGDVEVDGKAARAANVTNGGFFDFVYEDGRWFLDYFD